jgi:hypothetical protein
LSSLVHVLEPGRELGVALRDVIARGGQAVSVSRLHVMKEKSHKGQRHKGCGLCDTDKRAGNGESRRPPRDRRSVDSLRDDLTESSSAVPFD